MRVTKPAKALIFGFVYFLGLNLYLYLALTMRAAHHGLLANRLVQAIVNGVGLVITLPFVYLSFELRIAWLAGLSLVLNAIFWGLVFYAVLVILERRKRVSQDKTR
jgi:hypothetical protein